MRINKHLGIWMDHANAIIMELSDRTITQNIVKSKFSHQEKEQSIRKSEKLMHSKEQHEQIDYYKAISEIIKYYDDVIIFGPTNAKDELFNLLQANHRFSGIKIEVKDADRMSENQMHAFVKDYYDKA